MWHCKTLISIRSQDLHMYISHKHAFPTFWYSPHRYLNIWPPATCRATDLVLGLQHRLIITPSTVTDELRRVKKKKREMKKTWIDHSSQKYWQLIDFAKQKKKQFPSGAALPHSIQHRHNKHVHIHTNSHMFIYTLTDKLLQAQAQVMQLPVNMRVFSTTSVSQVSTLWGHQSYSGSNLSNLLWITICCLQ